jgi:nucleolar protein TMA23
MNAPSLLLSQGWQGPSHPLNPNSSTAHTHITKPLLISRKQNTLGVGNNPHDRHGKDQWWLRDFESALKSLGTGKAEVDKKEDGKGRMGKWGMGGLAGKERGLYGFFVKGEGLEGTIGSGSGTSGNTSGIESGDDEKEERRDRRKRRRIVVEGRDDREGEKGADEDSTKVQRKKKTRSRDKQKRIVKEGVASGDTENETGEGAKKKDKACKRAKREDKLGRLEAELRQLQQDDSKSNDLGKATAIRKLERRIRKRKAKPTD